jgi:hypothetical protein
MSAKSVPQKKKYLTSGWGWADIDMAVDSTRVINWRIMFCVESVDEMRRLLSISLFDEADLTLVGRWLFS